MIIFTKKAVIAVGLCGCFCLGIILFLVWSAVYAINVNDETVAYVTTFQEGRLVIANYLDEQKEIYGDEVSFVEDVTVTQEFKGNSVVCSDYAGAESILAVATALSVPAAVIDIDGVDVAAVASEKTAQEILDSLKCEENIMGDTVEIISKEFKGDVQVVVKPVAISQILDVNDATAVLSEKEIFDDTLDVVMKYTENVTMPEVTTVIPSDSLPAGYQEVVAAGTTGEQKNTVRAVISSDSVTEKEVIDSAVITKPHSKVVIEGTNLTMYDVMANGGLGATEIPLKGSISALYGSMGSLWSKAHTGLDIAAPEGSAIKSLGFGVVTLSGWNGAYGNMVIVEHGNGIVTRYGHMLKTEVKVGDIVNIGDILGLCGSTGNATGSHLHLEIKVDEVFQDPMTYF